MSPWIISHSARRKISWGCVARSLWDFDTCFNRLWVYIWMSFCLYFTTRRKSTLWKSSSIRVWRHWLMYVTSHEKGVEYFYTWLSVRGMTCFLFASPSCQAWFDTTNKKVVMISPLGTPLRKSVLNVYSWSARSVIVVGLQVLQFLERGTKCQHSSSLVHPGPVLLSFCNLCWLILFPLP